jgi:hypothetical protein
MATHLKHHLPSVSVTVENSAKMQQLLPAAFKQSFAAESDWAKAIITSIDVYRCRHEALLWKMKGLKIW